MAAPEHTPVTVLYGGPKIAVTGGLSPGGDTGGDDGYDVCAEGIRAQEPVGGDEEVLGRFVEPRSHEPLCRPRAQGEEDFPPRRPVVQSSASSRTPG